MNEKYVKVVSQLLFASEGDSLDFKKEQYAFAQASDDQKSEFLKDILAFTNSWRRDDAYILIGVEEVKGGRPNIVGVSDHLEDASLQQFVNSKTSSPVTFAYHPVEFEAKQIGVIHIPVQRRPAYLKKRYGKLEAEKVYLRRGSSTDLAKPDEIAQMGTMIERGGEDKPALEAVFVSGKFDEIESTLIEASTEYLTLPQDTKIPSYSESYGDHPAAQLLTIHRSVNRDYWRDLWKYTREQRLFVKLKLGLRNLGDASATNARVSLTAQKIEGSVVATMERRLGQRPQKTFDISRTPKFDITQAHEVHCHQSADSWRFEFEIGRVLPKEFVVMQEVFCIGATTSGELKLSGLAYANELPSPTQFELALKLDVQARQLPLSELDGELSNEELGVRINIRK
jgi:Putative DNA-binding domain